MSTQYPVPRFVVVSSPPSLGGLVMRRSTLDRFLFSPERSLPIQDRIDRYLARWRRRASELSDDATGRGAVDPIASALPALLQCPPPFAACTPRRHVCDRPSACPSCWARRVAATWSGLDRGVFAGGVAPPGLTMVVRVATYAAPAHHYDEELAALALLRPAPPIGALIAYRLARARPGGARLGRRRKDDLPSRAVDLARLRREPRVAAGLDATTVDLEPAPVEDTLAAWDAYSGGWRFAIHQVLFGLGDPPPALLDRLRTAPGTRGRLRPGRAVVAVVAAPSRRSLAEAVAAALPYPAEVMLRGDPGLVAEHILGWRRLRPAVRFGDFTALHRP